MYWKISVFPKISVFLNCLYNRLYLYKSLPTTLMDTTLSMDTILCTLTWCIGSLWIQNKNPKLVLLRMQVSAVSLNKNYKNLLMDITLYFCVWISKLIKNLHKFHKIHHHMLQSFLNQELTNLTIKFKIVSILNLWQCKTYSVHSNEKGVRIN